jgi:capsular exopolysaccharide synthesis family protein
MVPKNASVVDLAVRPTPTMSKATMLGLALIFSVMMAIGTGFLSEFADTTLRSPEEITNTIGTGYLGSIAKLKVPRQIVFSEGSAVNQSAESYTRVYSNIRFAEIEKPLRTILITSARKGEGKSTTLVNLACSMGSAGKRIIIVDTDLRNPTLQRILGTKHRHGLTSVLAGEVTLDEAMVQTSHPGLSLLPSGPIPPNPAELMHSHAMKELVSDLQSRADIILFDSPPAMLVADAMLLAGELDAALIVAEAGGVSRRAVQQVKESLAVTKTRILGVILNKVPESPGSYYNYYSYYNYREEEARPQTTLARIKDGFGSLRRTIGKSG